MYKNYNGKELPIEKVKWIDKKNGKTYFESVLYFNTLYLIEIVSGKSIKEYADVLTVEC